MSGSASRFRYQLVTCPCVQQGGTIVVRRGAAACVTADLISAAVAAGNSDHMSATAPVTNGVAALVPPIVNGLVTPRLVTASPGAPSPPRPIEAPRLDKCIGYPRRSYAITGMTQGCP